MQSNTNVVKYIKDGRKIPLEVGTFEPQRGDYLIECGNVLKIVMVTHKRTPTEAILYVETEDAPGILKEIKRGMKFGRSLN
ncbi:MAG: hypothetical protein JW716_00590 [Candidatus Aenigmarchaeota archaeon]|nr:hypothetical protein [Candidatus Aenigmarchaeota archaeon]